MLDKYYAFQVLCHKCFMTFLISCRLRFLGSEAYTFCRWHWEKFKRIENYNFYVSNKNGKNGKDLFCSMHMSNYSRQLGASLDKKGTSATKTSVSYVLEDRRLGL